MRRARLPFALLALVLSPMRASAVEPPRITPIGPLPGSDTCVTPHAISNDGSTVVGIAHATSTSGWEGQAFRWTSADGTVGIGALPGSGSSSWARGVSYDGSIVVGASPASSSEREAFRWTASEGMRGLGDLPGGIGRSEAHAISPDGAVVVGMANDGIDEAFLLSEATGMTGLGLLPGGTWSRAFTVSADGGVVAGIAATGVSTYQAFRWTPAAGMVALGDFRGVHEASQASAVTPDGRFIVGTGFGADPPDQRTVDRGFRWTPWTGLRSLGPLPEAALDARAWDVSADGHVIVGRLGSYAMIWDATRGYRRLDQVLTNDYGMDLSEWFALYDAKAISDDGRRIAGTGHWLGGTGFCAFVLDLPPACDDGLDNDADAIADLADPDCASAEDNVEAADSDGDWWLDDEDDCPTVANLDQADADGDTIGDACEHLAPVLSVPADHPTIQAAIDAAGDGTEIRVAPGVYVGNVDFRGKAVAVRSEAGPAATVIEGPDGDAAVAFRSGEPRGATLEGFTIQDSDPVSIEYASATLVGNVIANGRGIYAHFAGGRIERNLIEANRVIVLRGGGIYLVTGYEDMAIVGNRIRRNFGSEGGGLYVHTNDGRVRIEGNRIEDNEASSRGGGVQLRASAPIELVGNVIAHNRAPTGAGVSWSRLDAAGSAIVHNTIADNVGDVGSGLSLVESVFPVRIAGNIIEGEGFMVRCVAASGGVAPVFSANDVFGVWAPGYDGCADPTGTDGNIALDPRFLAPGGDYRLRSDSPLIDRSGLDAAELPARDALGAPRVADGDDDGHARADVGALERAPSCANGVDDDGDGAIDFPADAGCIGSDEYEDPPCHDGRDNDGDGAVDFPDDPGCRDGFGIEAPACDDGIDNDLDGLVDGGAPYGDPNCRGTRWRNSETGFGCGLGAELLIVLALLQLRGIGKLRTR